MADTSADHGEFDAWPRRSPDDRRPAADRLREDDDCGPLDVLVVGPSGAGGIDQYIDRQREELSDTHHVTTYDSYSVAGEDREDRGLGWFVETVLVTLVTMLRFPLRRRPDVVHVHTSYRFSFYRASLYVLVAAWLWRRPVVLHVHGSSFDDFVGTDSRLVAALQSVVFGAADRIVVLSPYWRDVLAARADERKLVVLPNAVQPDAYEPTYDADPPRIVYVSSLVDRKGILEFVEAIDQLCSGSDREFRVDIAGDGQHAERVERLADRREEARYLGYVSEARKQELLGDGSIYVLPTYAECLPIAMLEGMAGGNAVVATPVGGIPDVIDDRNGVLVPPGDQTALAEALEGLLASPAEIEQMGRRNRTLAREAFDWNGATDRLCRLYADVVDDPEVEVR